MTSAAFVGWPLGTGPVGTVSHPVGVAVALSESVSWRVQKAQSAGWLLGSPLSCLHDRIPSPVLPLFTLFSAFFTPLFPAGAWHHRAHHVLPSPRPPLLARVLPRRPAAAAQPRGHRHQPVRARHSGGRLRLRREINGEKGGCREGREKLEVGGCMDEEEGSLSQC